MNKDRRKRVDDLMVQLTDISSEIEAIKEEEQEAYDNLPESFQAGEKGDNMQNAIESLDEAENAVDEAQHALENVSMA